MTLHIVTGGIGTGKSRVRSGLGDLGWETADADKLTHLVLDGEARQGVGERFPTTVRDDGLIDRGRLAEIVFSDEEALNDLEALTHPHILRRIEEMAHREVVLEASDPSSGLLDSATTVIVVDAPVDLRREWLLARGMSGADIELRMASQRTRTQWLADADMVVPNTGTLTQLDHRIAQLDRWLRTRT